MGSTPIHWAALNNFKEVVECLYEVIEDKNPKNSLGQTPLHMSAKNGHVDIVRFFVDKDKNSQFVFDQFGKSPMDLAQSNGYNDIVLILS